MLLSLLERPVFLGPQSVFTSPLFQSYFDAKLFGFVVLGENQANVSRFVAKMRAASPYARTGQAARPG
ncbi:MAG TPA: hypothetical protein VH678_10390 [Xanthobacteraceae bacterium]|jgi:hypothetical protein